MRRGAEAHLQQLRSLSRDVQLFLFSSGTMSLILLNGIFPVLLNLYPLRLSVMAGVSSTALGVSWTVLTFGGGYLIAGLGYRALFLATAGLTVAGALAFAGIFHPRSTLVARWRGTGQRTGKDR